MDPIKHITDKEPPVKTYLLFRNVVLGFLLYYTLTLIPMSDMLFGNDDQVVPPFALSPYISYFIHALWYEPIDGYWWVFLSMMWVAAISIIRGSKISTFWMIAMYALTMNVMHKVYIVNTSGHQLLYIFLFFFIFIEWGRHRILKDPVGGTALMNGGVLAIKIQLCLLYFVSAIYKLQGSDWLSGKAIGYVLNVEQFSVAWIEGVDPTNPFLMFATYVTLAYQLLFPCLVWFRRIKLPFLLIGVITHLSIAFLMGLFEFGLIMSLSYLIFLPEDIVGIIVRMLRGLKGGKVIS